MKKIQYIIIPAFLIFLFACKKETENVSEIKKVSYPEIKLNGPEGDSVIFLPLGSPAYTEAGATKIDDITHAQSDLPYESMDVHTDSIGVYYVQYRAQNSNGFETERKRYIVVYNPADTADDYTGTYEQELTGRIVTVTQVAPRLFTCDDIYGTFTIPIFGFFVDYGDSLYIPQQPIDLSLGVEIHGPGRKSGSPGSYVLDFYGLLRDGNPRPRILIEQ